MKELMVPSISFHKPHTDDLDQHLLQPIREEENYLAKVKTSSPISGVALP